MAHLRVPARRVSSQAVVTAESALCNEQQSRLYPVRIALFGANNPSLNARYATKWNTGSGLVRTASVEIEAWSGFVSDREFWCIGTRERR